MDGVVSVERPGHRVGLVEFERVVGLWPVVDPGDVESGAVVADGGTTGTAEQVQ